MLPLNSKDLENIKLECFIYIFRKMRHQVEKNEVAQGKLEI